METQDRGDRPKLNMTDYERVLACISQQEAALRLLLTRGVAPRYGRSSILFRTLHRLRARGARGAPTPVSHILKELERLARLEEVRLDVPSGAIRRAGALMPVCIKFGLCDPAAAYARPLPRTMTVRLGARCEAVLQGACECIGALEQLCNASGVRAATHVNRFRQALAKARLLTHVPVSVSAKHDELCALQAAGWDEHLSCTYGDMELMDLERAHSRIWSRLITRLRNLDPGRPTRLKAYLWRRCTQCASIIPRR